MDSESNGLVMPEFLSSAELANLLRQKMPHRSADVDEMGRDDMIELASRLGCFPLPQRIPRDNRRGAVLKVEYEKERRKKTTSGSEIGEPHCTKRSASAGGSMNRGTKRLKPPPSETSKDGGTIQTKKIQLKKSTRSSADEEEPKGKFIKMDRRESPVSETKNDAGNNKNCCDEQVNYRHRSRHSPIKFP